MKSRNSFFKADQKDQNDQKDQKTPDAKRASNAIRLEKFEAVAKRIYCFEMNLPEPAIIHLKDLSEIGRWFCIKYFYQMFDDKRSILTTNPLNEIYFQDYDSLPLLLYCRPEHWKYNELAALKNNEALIKGKHFAMLKVLVTQPIKLLIIDKSELSLEDKDRLTKDILHQIKKSAINSIKSKSFQAYLEDEGIAAAKAIIVEVNMFFKQYAAYFIDIKWDAIAKVILHDLSEIFDLNLIAVLSEKEKALLVNFPNEADASSAAVIKENYDFYLEQNMYYRARQCDLQLKAAVVPKDVKAAQDNVSTMSKVYKILGFILAVGVVCAFQRDVNDVSDLPKPKL